MGKDDAIPESHKSPMLLALVDPKFFLESTAAALPTKDITEFTWDYITTTLIHEYNDLHVSTPVSSGGSSKNRGRHHLKIKRGSFKQNDNCRSDSLHNSEEDSEIDKNVNAFDVALQSSKYGQ